MAFLYQKKPEKSLRNSFQARRRRGVNRFKDYEEFKQWYEHQEKVCFYCGLMEEECQKVVVTSILKSKRFPQEGILGRGSSRGMWLEVDRFNPKDNYSIDNCVLCCYFCNNDKSDVFHGLEYKAFQQDRVGYLRKLIENNAE